MANYVERQACGIDNYSIDKQALKVSDTPDHLESIWYHSELSEVPYSMNKKLCTTVSRSGSR